MISLNFLIRKFLKFGNLAYKFLSYKFFDIRKKLPFEDNSIEAFEHKKYSIMGIMWHPERKKPFSRADKELIVNFINKSVGELK